MLPNSNSNVSEQTDSPHKMSFRVFVLIMYISSQRPHKQTQTKYITKYGLSGQSENDININN